MAGSSTTRMPQQARALEMESAGADIIDIGGESTRPGSEGISAAEQLRRILPVLEKLRGRLKIPISIDTSNVGSCRGRGWRRRGNTERRNRLARRREACRRGSAPQIAARAHAHARRAAHDADEAFCAKHGERRYQRACAGRSASQRARAFRSLRLFLIRASVSVRVTRRITNLSRACRKFRGLAFLCWSARPARSSSGVCLAARPVTERLYGTAATVDREHSGRRSHRSRARCGGNGPGGSRRRRGAVSAIGF